jgi:hypothetical protein
VHADLAPGLDGLVGPDVVAEADEPAVQAVHAVVDGKRVGDRADARLVQGEPALGDPVAVPADDLAEVRAAVGGHRRAVLGHVIVQGGEAEHHVGRPAVPAGNVDLLHDPAVGQDVDAHPVGVLEGVTEYLGVLACVRLYRAAERRLADREAAVVGGLLGPGGSRGLGGRESSA